MTGIIVWQSSGFSLASKKVTVQAIWVRTTKCQPDQDAFRWHFKKRYLIGSVVVRPLNQIIVPCRNVTILPHNIFRWPYKLHR
jgi:hypothetical protein